MIGGFSFCGIDIHDIGLEYAPDNDHILVVAFPKSDIGAKVTEGKKSKQSRTEAIVVREDYKDLQVQ